MLFDLSDIWFNLEVSAHGVERQFVPVPASRWLTAPGTSNQEALVEEQPVDGERMLICKISVNKIAGDHFTKLRNVLRNSTVEQDAEIITETREGVLRHEEQRKYRQLGPHVIVTLDAQCAVARKKAEQIAAGGLKVSALKGTRYEHIRWQMSDAGYIPGKDGRMQMILTPYRIPTFWETIGYRPNGKVATVTKRNRRSMADGPFMFEGNTVAEVESFIYFEGGDGVMHQHPCLDVVVNIDAIFVDGKEHRLRFPKTMVFGYVKMDGSPIADKILALTDGAHVFDQARFNKMIRVVDSGFAGYHEGDGIRFTFDNTGHGQGKGHGIMHSLAHRAGLILDTKKEFPRVDGRFSFVVMADLHRPKMPRLDPQTVINFRLAEGGFVSKYGTAWTDKIAGKIGDADALTALFSSYMNAEDVMDTYDMLYGDHDGKAPWVLGSNALLSVQKRFVVGTDGVATAFDYNLLNGEKYNLWAQPRLAARSFRHLTENLLEVSRCRIPVPNEEAVRAYAMFDVAIMDHRSKKFAGKGFFLSNGMLKPFEAVVFNTVEGRTAMVEGNACGNRQPNGHVGQMVRRLSLVKHARYTRMNRSPFLFLSCAMVELTEELKAWFTKLIGVRKLDVIVALWGNRVPFLVLANAIVGGGDLDDLWFVWTGADVVAYLRSQQAIVDSYPDETLNLDPAKAAGVPQNNRYAARFAEVTGKLAPANRYDRTAFYTELKRISKGGLIAPLTNANLIWTERWNAGDPIVEVNMAGYNRHQEEVIDLEVKLGTDIGGGAAKADSLFKAVKRVSKFLAHRIPAYLGVEFEAVDGVIDDELNIVNRASTELTEAFEAIFLQPDAMRPVDYLLACPVSFEADGLAQELRVRWNQVREGARLQVLNHMNESRFSEVPDDEKLNFAVGESVKIADKAISMADVEKPALNLETLFVRDQKLALETVIALYKVVATQKPRVDETTGKLKPIADAILYQSGFNTYLRDAMAYAKTFALTADMVTTEEGAEGALPEAVVSHYSLDAVNGMAKKPAEEVETWIAQASMHAGISGHLLDENDEQDMIELWTVCPTLKGRRMNAAALYLNNGSFYGFVVKNQLQALARLGKTFTGKLNRSMNTQTGVFNPFTVCVAMETIQ